jgi:hypothetical protein
MSIKMNVGISAAVITAAGAIAAALIGDHNNPVTSGSSVPSAPSTSVEGIGVVHVSRGVAAYVYGAPVSDGTSDRVGELSGGQQVEIVCTVQGPTITGTNGTSSVWDKVKFNQRYAYISDTELDTASDQPQAPSC